MLNLLKMNFKKLVFTLPVGLQCSFMTSGSEKCLPILVLMLPFGALVHSWFIKVKLGTYHFKTPLNQKDAAAAAKTSLA